MEKQDFTNFLIKDSQYYNSYCTYVGAFERNNITTIGQLLDDSLMALVMDKCHQKTRLQINGLISMLKYQYLGEPLCYEVLFDKDISAINDINNAIKVKNNDEQIYVNVMSLLGCPRGTSHMILGEFRRVISNSSLCNEIFPQESIRLIDFLKWILTIDANHVKRVHPFVTTYIELYKKKNNMSFEDINKEGAEALKKELEDLIRKRNDIDARIENIKSALSKTEKRGNIK